MCSKMAIDRLITRRDVRLREMTVWQMLHETCACSEEVLDINIEDLDLDLAGRRPADSKGVQRKVRRCGGAREELRSATELPQP
ncbi:hypothetical protein AB0E10_39325 [Streptomyces sp. NPDC048045]|uniref:hypothetical protein n=1 Tax=Streptomyces sp. NPDC048045 TaxID=3154710 RepID=UPI00341FC59D